MNNIAPFKVFNASAGSGKTFNLVKSYLKLLFKTENIFGFRNILAMTFTNKAVGEMKERILKKLKDFSEETVLDGNDAMFNALCLELNLQPEYVNKKAKTLLSTIMHNYAAFDISTIDGFNHRLIRTFAYDLKLPINFEVELDTEALLNEAVDSLIAKAGTDKKLTKILIDFAIEKADDDKSWDISNDLNKIAKKLTNENDIPHLKEALKNKTLDDFESLKTSLIKQIKSTENQIIDNAKSILTTFENNGLTKADFSRGTLFNHFEKASLLQTNGLYNNQLESNIEENKVYTTKLDANKKDIIDSLLPEIGLTYKTIKAAVSNLNFLKAIYKNVTPLSVLNAINSELQLIKDNENKLLISEFNTLISNQLKDQPTPFIYERIGEKFRHYFIDEFQDTSEMQWNNLIPLIENSLTAENLKGEKGSAMIVGDAKQAIYRWRGGKAEQFIDLTEDKNPFPVDKKLIELEENYRSHKNIVTFNNSFFQYISNTSFRNEHYANLYKKANQNPTIKEEGYVSFQFLDLKESEDDKETLYAKETYNTLKKCLDNGYDLKDICVLVRKKKEGIAVANYLSENDIKIMSSETMLIDNSESVQLINNILRLLVNPNNFEVRINVLHYLASIFNVEDKHTFFNQNLKLNIDTFFGSFKQFGIDFNTTEIAQLSLYDSVEDIARQFNLLQNSDAFVQFYLDLVLEFSQKNITGISGFLDYYDNKKDSLSIVSPNNQNAVQIMTIHKSKGLEFPVVIFPFADLDIYREIDPQEWFPIDKTLFNGFSKTLINFNSDVENFGEIGQNIYNKHKAEQELDNINLLYVALTRPIEQLHVISKTDNNLNELNSYSKLFQSYLQTEQLWSDNQNFYEFGNSKREIIPAEKSLETSSTKNIISVNKKEHNIKIITKSGYLWDTNQQHAIEKGNIIHDIMSKIYTKDDIDFAINLALDNGLINDDQVESITKNINDIVNQKYLKEFFTDQYTIYNERDILTSTGQMIRPDRLAIKDNQATIIDYKTGLPNPKYEQQLEIYATHLKEMGYQISNKILVFINENIQTKNYN
ncbi:exodeoxyribonuclease V subunit beta [Mesoflavibacter sp. SCSIO 43206]|uniref:UvrD-helicase domain-containing protein n=1 Tax=Mesoflavibacter sp. SCSIO 43206 TaxID=2779362 RepID=UPI001CA90B6A|nr:UvrD-helicase domain-containing protein [Mesoflavibacter sp. SCSIO 43206]UAB76513.1 UvrD-helicase domain-containing protein [Mesoflavibacter sp. SCSIO 43206]